MNPGIRRATLPFLAGLALVLGHSASAMQHAFLVQNSGWMEPFYVDPASQFKPLAGAVIRLVAAADDKVFISAFNQTSGDNKSPVLLAQTTGAGDPDKVLARLTVAVKNKAGALADTDFQEAVAHVIKEQFQAKPGIVWIFTNNRNSPNNDAQTALRNKDFYRLLHLEPSITRTVVFPLRMPVKGKFFSATGMMVYALAYGDAAAEHLATVIESGQLSKVFTNPPARLKPIDQDSVRLVPSGVTNSANIAISLAKDGRTLLLDVQASDVLPQVEIKTGFQNLLYPYVIHEAHATASLAGAWGKQPVAIQPEKVESVLPGESREMTVSIPMPMAQVPSPWSAAAVAAMGQQLLIPAVLEIALADQRLVLSDRFKQNLSDLFPGDPLSDVFLPPESKRASTVSVPMLIRIQYPLLPVVMALLLALLVIGGLVSIAVLGGTSARYVVVIDGAKRAVALKAFKSTDVRNANGVIVGKLTRGLGKPKVSQVVDGHTVVLK